MGCQKEQFDAVFFTHRQNGYLVTGQCVLLGSNKNSAFVYRRKKRIIVLIAEIIQDQKPVLVVP